jgi:hypothetical protein
MTFFYDLVGMSILFSFILTFAVCFLRLLFNTGIELGDDLTDKLQEVIDNPPDGWVYRTPLFGRGQGSFVYKKKIFVTHLNHNDVLYKIPDNKIKKYPLRVGVNVKRGRIYGKTLCLGTLTGAPACDIEKIPEMLSRRMSKTRPPFDAEDIFYVGPKLYGYEEPILNDDERIQNEFISHTWQKEVDMD